jgi:CRISPR-associated protein Cas1
MTAEKEKFRTPLRDLAHVSLLPAEANSRFFHVTRQGATLRRDGTRIRVTVPAAAGDVGRLPEILAVVPVLKLQGVLLYGNIQVTTQLARLLLEQGVWVSFLTGNGVYRGRLQPPCERGGRLRQRQRQCMADAAFCLAMSKSVVQAKILGAQSVAAAYASNYVAESLGEARTTLREQLGAAANAENVAQLRGIEGTAARAWFDLFRRANRSGISFGAREGRGAGDPVNSLLNFGYTLLCRELEGLLESAGLDPTLGFYHAELADRPSLACDWMEEFRHAVVDRLVLRLLNTKVIRLEDFEDRGERGGMRLRVQAVGRFVNAYENTMLGRDPEQPGFRQIFLGQLAALLDAMRGEPYRCWLSEPA